MDAIFSESQLEQVARTLWKEGNNRKVWAFHAPMGTGKTTFIRALCRVLGVDGNTSSPTFAIVNQYMTMDTGIIYHMDWYRLKGEEEAIAAGVEEHLVSGSLCLVEWPENAPGLLPDDCLHIHMESLDAVTRRLYTETGKAANS